MSSPIQDIVAQLQNAPMDVSKRFIDIFANLTRNLFESQLQRLKESRLQSTQSLSAQGEGTKTFREPPFLGKLKPSLGQTFNEVPKEDSDWPPRPKAPK